MTAPAIVATGLTRRFGPVVAVDAVDLAIPAGVLFGFLGLNGAGKTTLIRMLLGLIRPDAGRVTILGRAVGSTGGPAGPWAQVGYLVDGPGLYPELTTREHLRTAAAYRGTPRAGIDEIVERLALERYLDVRARALSSGNRQRLGLAMALLHRPHVLLLDEPTVGMDPAGVVEIREMLRGLADAGAAVMMSTHIVGEVERTADEVGILHEGRLVETLSRDRLARLGSSRLELDMPDAASTADALAVLGQAGVGAEADGARLATQNPAALARPEEVVGLLARGGCPPRGVRVVADTLEAHFLRVTGGGQ